MGGGGAHEAVVGEGAGGGVEVKTVAPEGHRRVVLPAREGMGDGVPMAAAGIRNPPSRSLKRGNYCRPTKYVNMERGQEQGLLATNGSVEAGVIFSAAK